MPKTVTIEKLEKEIEKLPPKDQLKRAERLAHHLRKTGLSMKKELDLAKLYGLGKGLWGERTPRLMLTACGKIAHDHRR